MTDADIWECEFCGQEFTRRDMPVHIAPDGERACDACHNEACMLDRIKALEAENSMLMARVEELESAPKDADPTQ